MKLVVSGRHDDFNATRCPGFAWQDNAPSFFRPGQIFAAQIVSSLYLNNGRKFRDVDFGHLTLEPISKLKA